jgi:hypothetical protein
MLTRRSTAGATFGEAPPEAIFGSSKAPALHQPLSHREAHVVGRVRVLPAWIPQTDYQPIDGSATATKGASQSGLLL